MTFGSAPRRPRPVTTEDALPKVQPAPERTLTRALPPPLSTRQRLMARRLGITQLGADNPFRLPFNPPR